MTAIFMNNSAIPQFTPAFNQQPPSIPLPNQSIANQQLFFQQYLHNQQLLLQQMMNTTNQQMQQMPPIQPLNTIIQQLAVQQPVQNPIRAIPKKPKMSRFKSPGLGAIDEDNEIVRETPKSAVEKEKEALNASAEAFVPSSFSFSNVSPPPPSCEAMDSYTKFALFTPKHKARAKLNIYIPKKITKSLLGTIAESFPNANDLYYYLDISTALQINDRQINLFKNDSNQQLAIINFDLHSNDTNDVLYAIVVPNNRTQNDKWLWKLDRFLKAKEISKEYNISTTNLPKSSRTMINGINAQLKRQIRLLNNGIKMPTNIDWSCITQIGSTAKVKKAKKKNLGIRCVLDMDYFQNEVSMSWNQYSEAIPIIVYENSDMNNSAHWIEWIKLVYISKYDCFVGISFEYNAQMNDFEIGSIYLDRGDICNKYRLFGSNNSIINAQQNVYSKHFDILRTSITELNFSMNH